MRQVARGQIYVDRRIELGRQDQSPVTLASPALSEREGLVLRLTALGHDRFEIARRLGLSPRTLETYRSRGMHKLQLRSRADLMSFAAACGWLREAAEDREPSGPAHG